jgi:L-alanine-DL-glutamate epimerase-like enolase superfamily enzyme
MDRRSFLQIAGMAAVMSRDAAARILLVLKADEDAPIAKVEWIRYEIAGQGSAGAPEQRCVVRIWTDTGLQGWAEAPGAVMPDRDRAAAIRSVLLERDLGQHDSIWRELYQQGLPLETLGAIDVALWDLHGRIENKPVHALLGTKRSQAKAYVTTPFNLGEPGQYAEYALACKEKDVPGCKIHPYVEWGAGHGGLADAGFPDRDIAAYQAVRDAVGPDYACLADNHRTYTLDNALRVGRILDDLGFEWLESPMPESDDWRQRYVSLAAQVRTPICAPETHPGSYFARLPWITEKACDIACIDVSRGGLTACLELALACEAAGIRLELKDLGPDSYPHLQLLGATSESLIRYVELSSLSQEAHTRPGRTTPEPVFDATGCVAIPQSPGMGLELDWNYIHAHRAG